MYKYKHTIKLFNATSPQKGAVYGISGSLPVDSSKVI